LNTYNIKALSIQISLNGLSFCILNRTLNTIEFLHHVDFDKKTTPFETLEHLIRTLDAYEVFSQPFKSVLIIYQNELSILVPKPLFDEQNAADYLKFNTKILKTDYITYDELSVNESINVYVPLVNINNYIFERFGPFDYKHVSTVLVDTILQKESRLNDGNKMFVNVNTNHFEISIINNGKLLLYNTFEYQTKEDFIYFILFTIEQLKLDTETTPVYLSGRIKNNDELYTIAYKYIRHIAFVEPNYKYKFTEQLNNKHNDYVILNSFN
jgi:hypothetical protein